MLGAAGNEESSLSAAPNNKNIVDAPTPFTVGLSNNRHQSSQQQNQNQNHQQNLNQASFSPPGDSLQKTSTEVYDGGNNNNQGKMMFEELDVQGNDA